MFGFMKKNQEPSADLSTFGLLPGKKIKICSADFRDGQQSLYATRFQTREILPIIPQMDEAGYASMEMWGGATFDVCMRYLNDDPWERLRQIKAGLKHTPTMMLLRGQNLVGYRQYADDVVEKFVELAAKNGMDIFVVFDGLNDARNCETAIRAVKKNGKRCYGSILYTVSPIHNTQKLVETAMAYKNQGVDAILLADMAGQMTPEKSYESVKALKEATGLPIQVSYHATGGMAYNACWEAIRAGAEIITCCASSLSGGTSLPSAEVISAMLSGAPCDPGMDLNRLEAIDDEIHKVCNNHMEFRSQFTGVNVKVLKHQVPGGMLSNLVSQLKEAGQEDKYREVLEEIPRVRKDFGEPPLVTPSSQIVGTQAVLNVIMGERYKMVPKESKKIMLGEFGQTVKPFNPEVQKKIIGDETPITCRPADLIAPQLPQFEKECAQWKQQDEDVLSYALFPQVAKEFFIYREAQQTKVDQTIADKDSKAYPV